MSRKLYYGKEAKERVINVLNDTALGVIENTNPDELRNGAFENMVYGVILLKEAMKAAIADALPEEEE